MNPNGNVNWIDLKAIGARVLIAEYPEEGSLGRAVMLDLENDLLTEQVEMLSSAGFVRASGPGISYVRPGASFTLSEIRRVFERALPVMLPRSKTRVALAASPFSAPAARPAPIEVTDTLAMAPVPRGPLRPPLRPLPPRMVPRVQSRVAAETPPPPAPPPAQAAPVAPAPVSPPPVRVPPPLRRPAPTVVAVDLPPTEPDRVEVAAPVGPPATMEPEGLRPETRRSEPATADGEAKRLNRFQYSYLPASRVGAPIAAIPVNLAGATASALARLEEAVGAIDDYVADKLGWTAEEMAVALSPEQVDAVGLALYAASRGQAFVLADQTGLGKGRVLAALARAKVIEGKPVIFITEKENLFSDFFRDLADIDSADLVGKPFILNTDAEIVRDGATEREVLHRALKKADQTPFLKEGRLPKGTKLTMATYSQFNRKGAQKTEFLSKIAPGAHLLVDESHNAVGDSNTSEALALAMDVADNVTFSSATFARNASNLSAYRRLFPISMRSSDLMGVLSAGGQAVSEALSGMLAEDGAYLRREHDLSSISIEVVEDAKRMPRNKAIADAISPVLASLARLARTVSDVVNERNEPGPDGAKSGKGGKEFWSAGNFGSRLSGVVRQLVTCLLVERCVEEASEALSKGVKPVIVIESTMESLMREMSSDDNRPDSDESEVDHSLSEGIELAREKTSPPDFRDALRLFLDRTLQVTVRRHGAEPEKVVLDDPWLREEAAKIRDLIDAVPDLLLSPIDEVRARIESVGASRGKTWVAEEISARGMRVVDDKYVQMPQRDRTSLVSGFNAGHYDALVITRAASTGLSLHASEKVKDKRRRMMIELQIASNVVERMQFFGRVNRRGQVSTPYFRTLSTGLPLQSRQLAMQNRKMQDLSANVSGSAQSSSEMDIPDMINPLGNKVCRRLLEERPSIADRMFIAMRLPDPEKAEAELYHVNKFLQRLVLLPSQEQDALYLDALRAYQTELADASAKSGRGSSELEGAWKVVEREVFEAGDPRDGPIFGRAVTLTTIESEVDLTPLRVDAIADLVRNGTASLPKSGGEAFGAELRQIARMRDRVLQRAVPARLGTVAAALADSKPNAVKDASQRHASLMRTLGIARPGCVISVGGDDGVETGVIVEVRRPTADDELHIPSSWTIRYVVPGDERPRQISVAGVNNDPSASVWQLTDTLPADLVRKFESAPGGKTPVRRKVLDGNLVRAVIAARHQGWGSAVTFQDENGHPNRAILIPKSKQGAVIGLPGRTTAPEAALAVLKEGGEIWTNKDIPDDGIRLAVDRRAVTFEIPVKKASSKGFEMSEILAITGPLKGGQKVRHATVDIGRAPLLLQALARAEHAFHFEGRYRKAVAQAMSALTPDEPEPEAGRPGPR